MAVGGEGAGGSRSAPGVAGSSCRVSAALPSTPPPLPTPRCRALHTIPPPSTLSLSLSRPSLLLPHGSSSPAGGALSLSPANRRGELSLLPSLNESAPKALGFRLLRLSSTLLGSPPVLLFWLGVCGCSESRRIWRRSVCTGSQPPRWGGWSPGRRGGG